MMNRRDLLLNEMNISQWVLVKPQVLKGDGVVRVGDNIKLVVITNDDIAHSGLLRDVTHALDLSAPQVTTLNFEQAARLEHNRPLLMWLIGADMQAGQFQQKFAKNPLFHTACWQDLRQSAQKRQLWQQIEPLCRHLEER